MGADSAIPLPPAATMGLADPAAPTVAAAVDPAAVRKVADDFESFFLGQSFESMFAGVGNDNLFGGGEGETVYRSLLLQEYAKVAAKNGGLGIADEVQREMLRLQEAK